MFRTVQTDTSPTGSAVSLNGVTKTFSQWQRDNTGKNIIRNLLKPEKRAITALDSVSFSIAKGEFAAYAGPNGAGKSTTMKLISGMLQPNGGDISVMSLSPRKQRLEIMKQCAVLFGNRTELWWDHPVIQSFEWKKVVWDIPDKLYKENLSELIEMLDIRDLLKTFARELSLGQRMRADLAMALLHGPSLLLLDEPTLGLDVVAKRRMIDFLKAINRENGVTIIVTSHDMDDLEEMAQRILMISNGRIAYDGGFDGLRAITGSLTRVTVTMSGACVPSFSGGSLISAKNRIYEFEVDVSKNPIQLLLKQLSESDGIQDVQINKAPIEQVIAGLYGAWKQA